MNIIGLLDKPDNGEITFREASIQNFNENEAAAYRNRNIGFVFQDHLLLPHLTVLENILLPLLAAHYSKEELAGKEIHVGELMKSVGISELADKYPFNISGGEAQRVAIVRALANNPSLLLADEPTGALDSKNAEILGELLLKMNRDQNIAIVLATHSPDLAQNMSRRYRLKNGKLADLTDRSI
jgi:ABC-type lipoprotein export system ATPase subunit